MRQQMLRVTTIRLGLLVSLLAGSLAIIVGSTAASANSADDLGNALLPAYASFRHIPTSAVGGVVPGSVHEAPVSPGGTQWAIASFKPAAGASSSAGAAFQDGASTGIFAQNPDGSWTMKQEGGEPLVCTPGVPANLWQAWGMVTSGITCPIQATATAIAKSPGARLDTAFAATPSGATDTGGSVASIATQQVGVSDSPASTDWDLDCNPYTALDGVGQSTSGCGTDPVSGVQDENELWCSDFTKWVWKQAGVPDTGVLTPAAASFYNWARDNGQSPQTDPLTPSPGDAVVFYPAGSSPNGSYADHVGIVTAVNADGTIDMVNGDFMGSANIAVEYDSNVVLPTWSAANWGTGESWTFVSPTGA